ncbi:ATP-dependent zinc metalloprotease FtsH [Proteiniclasticum sp. QWL-01]|uniref:ATP-dependent zinc metalloprotease FtsH n=1 Tax=Proteiniclasticum sp. QWL-01 TaxID=3036945 RepID=UPI00240FF863|nr:ATP-dependent zinc metalloprotease FtsH [Proteiniclasticum sp. QWL-01]WFF72412.1 ATP-dependent zinc metalloprotease FtsH [Proteiniclasticum sp. QWL-01]
MEQKPQLPLSRLAIMSLILLVLIGVAQLLPGAVASVDYNQFISQVNEGKLSSVRAFPNGSYMTLTGLSAQDNKETKTVMLTETYRTLVESNKELAAKVTLSEPAGSQSIVSQLAPFLSMLLTLGLLVFFVGFLMRNNNQGPKSAANFGKSKARLVNPEQNDVTFAQVAGAEEEKFELMEVVDFLKNPAKYQKLGAKIPKGLLMVGYPGTGKTLLARAVAGEAGVPFYIISGSDFVEMFVGVGASRVRDLFDQAKRNAPCIVFLDEIDAVGRQRGTGFGGGHDEREQTLNQLLVEMDGFEENQGIVVMAATNRADVLDPALLRPGRFDRQIHIDLPDSKGREEILKIHTRNKPLGDDVNLKIIAKTTTGFSGAELQNLANEAALLAAREAKPYISMAHFEEARTKVQLGPEKKSRVQTDESKHLTAYHEAGHAIVARSLPTIDPVTEISIIPRGRAGGYTMHIPLEDTSYTSRTSLLDDLATLFGGRCAEKLILNDISTGAKSDIDRASKIARAMVKEYGMSDVIGNLSFGDAEEVFLGRDMGRQQPYSEAMGDLIDQEVKKLVDSAYHKAEEILKREGEKLHLVAQSLLAKETLQAYEFEALFTTGKLPEPLTEVEARKANEKVLEDYSRRKRQALGNLRQAAGTA